MHSTNMQSVMGKEETDLKSPIKILYSPQASGYLFAAVATTAELTTYASVAGFAPGCIMIDMEAGVVYRNSGSATSSTWTTIS